MIVDKSLMNIWLKITKTGTMIKYLKPFGAKHVVKHGRRIEKILH